MEGQTGYFQSIVKEAIELYGFIPKVPCWLIALFLAERLFSNYKGVFEQYARPDFKLCKENYIIIFLFCVIAFLFLLKFLMVYYITVSFLFE